MCAGQRRPAFGQRAGLVEHKMSGACQTFHGVTAGGEQAEARQRAGGGGEGCRCREPERARAGDHQYGDRDRQDAGGVELPPDERHGRGQQQQANDKVAGHAIGNLGEPRLAGQRAIEQPQDGRQHRVRAGLLNAHQERALAIDRSANHRIARRAREWQALAGEQRFVDAAAAFDDHAVGRDGFARTHAHQIAGFQLRDRHECFDHMRRFCRLASLADGIEARAVGHGWPVCGFSPQTRE